MSQRSFDKPVVYFLSFVGSDYSRSSTILNFRTSSFEKKYLHLPTGILKIGKVLFLYRKELRQACSIVVMSPCHIVTPIARLIVRKPIILDAGWPLLDGLISRGIWNSSVLKFPGIAILDFIAFHCADRILVESTAQINRLRKYFMLNPKRIRVLYTGITESVFANPNVKTKLIKEIEEKAKDLNYPLTVIFRGKINRESGISNIIDSAKLLEGKVLFIFVIGQKDAQLITESNRIVVSGITANEMKQIYEIVDVAVGQVSEHARLNYTIPHKAFEAGFFAKPYITADSAGIRELYGPDSAILMDQISAKSLAYEILRFMEPNTRTRLGTSIHARYQEKASQKVINSRFENILEGL
jgi:glycosyltransferase involved in cell wall biosynthesis